ncbi:hypothetical protein [Streptomyces sp. NPDC088794]|uniref:hypothetical protein n=1 Tax=Streptomyces sp. NPDC088794 TaxID=3365902 RepID=UPI00381EBD34
MTTSGPDGEEVPHEPAAMPAADEVWLRFLMDCEQAIRASAPREPSAQKRMSPLHPPHRKPYRTARPEPRLRNTRADNRTDVEGDPWHPDDPWPPWRDLDGPAKFRRIGRVIATAAAIAVALGAWSMLSTRAGVPGDESGDATIPPHLTAVEPTPYASPVD